MSARSLTTDEVIERGKALYENGIRAKVEKGNKGKFLIIDVETGHCEVDARDGRL